MKYLSIYAIGIILLLPLHSTSVIASGDIDVPFELALGQMLYDENCSSCHGLKLSGTDRGPPLIHPYYKPSHHGDEAFYRAALQGVQQHHWEFGDMPPVAGMTRRKMDKLVPYVRYYQQQMKLY
jgi:mono/diheme cytochrome c family protein